MTRILLLFVLIASFMACRHSPAVDLLPRLPKNARLKILKLADSLGEAAFFLPARYDNTFIWTHRSDCGKSCEKIKYRFQPGTLPVVKESGWAWFGDLKDSVERFTIVHSGYFPFYDGIDSNITMADNWHRKEMLFYEQGIEKVKSDTIEKINDRYFSIIVIDQYDGKGQLFTKKVLALTTIKGNYIEFNYELLTREKNEVTENFIANSIDLLRTINLSKGR